MKSLITFAKEPPTWNVATMLIIYILAGAFRHPWPLRLGGAVTLPSIWA